MVDWSGHDGTATARRYRVMADRQFHGISPSYERLCLGVADDAELLAHLDTLPAPKRQPNLLLGAVRFIDGPVDSYPPFRSFVLSHWDELAATMLARRTQTNEPRRCATLLPALAALPQPLALLEVGTSAGLCLYPDRYAYRYDDGPALGASPVLLTCTTSGPVPIPTALPTVAWRGGLDLNPLNVRNDDDMRWLRSLIWPEETERYGVLHEAAAVAAAEPADIRRGDLTTDLAVFAADAPQHATLVVFHSAVVSYLSDPERASFRAQLDEIAATRLLVWVSNEGPGVCVDLPAPKGSVPFVLARDGVPLAFTGPHGESVQWFEPSSWA